MQYNKTKIFKTLKYSSIVILSLIFSFIIGLSNTYAASSPIGSLKYPIGSYTSDFSSKTNLYPFKYQEYSQEGSNSYRTLSFQTQVYKTGTDAENFLLQYDKYATIASAGQSWYVFKMRLNFHAESTYTTQITVTDLLSAYNFTEKTGKSLTLYDYDNFYLNYDALGYKKGLSSLPINPGEYIDFYYAILIDSSVGYPLFKFNNYAGSLEDHACYVSLDPSRQNKLDICGGKATVGSNITYTGKARATTYKVYDEFGKELVKNTDYTVSYFNNINPGVATVKFTGKGNYEGIMEYYFYIKPTMTTLTFSNVTSSSAKLSWKAVPNAYQYNIYKYNTTTKKYVYLKCTYSTSTYVSDMASACTYKYAVYPYIKAKDPYTGYTLTNTSNKTIYIKGSPAVKSVTTRPLPAKMKKLTLPAKKTASVWWNKATRASGYKIVVSTGYGLKGVVKTYYTTSTAKKLTGLPSGKYVYINVIPYKTVGSTKLYSQTYYYYYTKIK